MKSTYLAVLMLALVAAIPARANSTFDLSCNGVACGTVVISNISGGVTVNVTMTGGYSIQAQSANGFFFNTTGVSALSISNLTVTPFGAVGAQFSGSSLSMNGSVSALEGSFNGGSAGKFTWDLVKFGIPNGNTSVTGISFTLLGSGLSEASFVPNSNGIVLGVHYCSPGANGLASTNCPTPTGFAPGTPVPEPGTLGLLGTGLLGLAGLVRRRLRG
jgi:PEP-CTERM motif-containing protein